ncbi:MAG: hypothetical protein JNM07_14525, partial [Phycisphaerae bacterium]|nr:hypothetical protein [Phycisphaerae bacterium]
ELKEGCTTHARRETIARLTYPRFFARYLHLAGMSGTIAEVAPELAVRYASTLVRIPTHRPLARRWLGTHVHLHAATRWQAIVERAAVLVAAGRAVGDARRAPGGPRTGHRRAERPPGCRRGGDHCRGRRPGTHHRRHQHGRARHRHRPRSGGARRRWSGGDPQRIPRIGPHRPPALRPRRSPGRSGHGRGPRQPRRRAVPALRRPARAHAAPPLAVADAACVAGNGAGRRRPAPRRSPQRPHPRRHRRPGPALDAVTR